MIWLLGILLYTIVSVLFSIHATENEYRNERWYDVPLMMPACLIAYTWMWVDYILELKNERTTY